MTEQRRRTLNAHLRECGIRDDLRGVINDIARAGKRIHHEIRTSDPELTDLINPSVESQLNLDLHSNYIAKVELGENGLVHTFASEEEKDLEKLGNDGPFLVACDPLDGSSVVKANFAIGSIFGVYRQKDILGLTPRAQEAALYLVYGQDTRLVCCAGNGVHEYYLDSTGEFLLLHRDLLIREDAKTFSPGNLRAVADRPGYRKMVNGWIERGFTLRYSGALVADVHHVLTSHEGIFTNVGGGKFPQGKLRLLFECGPLAYIVEHAGGASSNGDKSLLDVAITELHQRTQIIVGSKTEVRKVCEALRGQ
jgi:fructose-1,6-bisphosphatase